MAIAPMGYIGGVRIFGQASIRATSCSLNSRQAINHPDVIDGTVDWTLYQLGGIEVDGDVALPVVTGASGAGSPAFLFDLATKRDSNGELVRNGTVEVTYGHQQGRRFNGCKCNTLEMRATAGERMDATINFWGTDAVRISGTAVPPIAGQPTRVLTWNDITIAGSSIGDTCIVREFSFTINNNLSRNYTFCPASGLFPNNISTGKRNISGSLGFQGFAPTETQAESNKNKIHPDTSLSFSTTDGFNVEFLNVIYEFQSIEAQPGVITSSVNWYAHADGGGQAFV